MKTFLEWPPDARQQTPEEHREQQRGEGGGEAAVSLCVRVGSAAAAGHRVPINIRTVRRWRAGLRTHGLTLQYILLIRPICIVKMLPCHH